mmetsp:Transcript_23938/g.69235  ORF Transcript_23938/g.69235 Transcript_23938/m.69235 type:complete len:106 (+) Transcript_23938:1245-1562(+)
MGLLRAGGALHDAEDSATGGQSRRGASWGRGRRRGARARFGADGAVANSEPRAALRGHQGRCHAPLRAGIRAPPAARRPRAAESPCANTQYPVFQQLTGAARLLL